MDVSRGLLEPKAGNQVGSRQKRRLKPGDIDREPVAQLGRVGSNPTPGAKSSLIKQIHAMLWVPYLV